MSQLTRPGIVETVHGVG